MGVVAVGGAIGRHTGRSAAPHQTLPDLRGPLVALVVAALITSLSVVAPTLTLDGPSADPDIASEQSPAAAATAAASQSQLVSEGAVPDGLTADEWSSIQRQVSAAEAVEAVPSSVARASAGAIAQIASAGTVARFSAAGAAVTAAAADRSVTLQAGTIGDVALEPTEPVMVNGRAYYLHTPMVTEWYRDTVDGLQQLFTIAEPVTADPTTRIVVDVAGGTPTLVDDQTVVIDATVGGRFVYRDLVAWDATGTLLPAAMDVVDGAITLNVETAGAKYPITIDPIITEDQKLVPTPDAAGDLYGWAVDVDGDRMAVSAIGDDTGATNAGAVYMYRRNDATSPWQPDGVITSPAPELDGKFGDSVAVIGDQVAIGESDRLGDLGEVGRVWVFVSVEPSTWVQRGSQIFDPGAPVPGGFGAAVAWLDADRLIVGAPEYVSAAGVSGGVFQVAWAGSDWGSAALLGATVAPAAGDLLGYSVAASQEAGGSYVIVAGAPGHDRLGGTPATDSGALQIYRDSGAGASPLQLVEVGLDWGDGDRIGTAVASDRGYLAVAGIGEGSDTSTFQAYLLEPTGSNFFINGTFSSTLPDAISFNPVPNDYLDLVGRNLFLSRPGGGGQVGVLRDIDGNGFGVLTDPVDVFTPVGRKVGDAIGRSISAQGGSLVAGAPGDDDSATSPGADSGAVYTQPDVPLTHTFIGPGDQWVDAANWDTGIVPDDPDDTVIIPVNTTEVQLVGDFSVGRLVVATNATLSVMAGSSMAISGGAGGSEETLILGTGIVQNSGTVVLQNSTTQLDGFLLNGVDGVIEFSGGSPGAGRNVIGAGTLDNDGTIRSVGLDNAVVFDFATLNSDPGARLEVGASPSAWQILPAYTESGTIVLSAGAQLSYPNGVATTSDTEIITEIVGDSDSWDNYGILNIPNVTALDFQGATLRADLNGYAPTSSDVYDVVQCLDCAQYEVIGSNLVFAVAPLVANYGFDSLQLTVPGPIIVDDSSDTVLPGGCSLREAVDKANADSNVGDCRPASGADVIRFDEFTTSVSVSSPLLVTSDVVIDGEGRAVEISGDSSAILTNNGSLELRDVRVTNGGTQNCVIGTCGPVVNNTGATLTVVDSTFEDNVNATISNGGAITNRAGGTLDVRRTTFANNSVTTLGGAIYNRGAATVANSTFVGNGAQFGGAVYNDLPASMMIVNSTFSDNSSAATGGSVETGNSSLDLQNSIVRAASGNDCAGTVNADVHNFDSDGTCGAATTSARLSLQPLEDNGGPTQTVALGTGSDAFDAGDATVCAAAPADGVDQRGEVRPQGLACDSGAYEAAGTPGPVVFNYIGPGVGPNNQWTDAANWDQGSVPTPIDYAYVDLPAAGTVAVTGAQEIASLDVGPDTTLAIDTGGVLTVSGGVGGIESSNVSGVVAVGSGAVLELGASNVNLDGDVDVLVGGELRFIGSGAQSLSGESGGLLRNQGTFRNLNSADSVEIGPGLDYVSEIGSVTEVISGGSLVFNTFPGVTEQGTLVVSPGAAVEYRRAFFATSDATIEIEIDGPSSDPANSGQLLFTDSAPPDFSTATLRSTLLGYSPTGSDAYSIVSCNDCGDISGVVLDIDTFLASVNGTVPGQTIDLTLAAVPGQIVVDTLADTISGGACSLRAAITAANTDAVSGGCAAGSGADTIVFGVSGTISLTSPLARSLTGFGSPPPSTPAIGGPIVSDIVIDGAGENISINGQNAWSVFFVGDTGSLVLSDLTVLNGRTQRCIGGDRCAAVLNYGSLEVRDTAFLANRTIDGSLGNGGAITNRGGGILTVDSSLFFDNSSDGQAGAIWNASGNATGPDSEELTVATITNSTFVGNAGNASSAIYNTFNAQMTITNSTVVSGGGADTIRNASGPGVTLRNTIVTAPPSGTACITGGITADSFNIVDDGSCGNATSSASLNLGALADNGGPTQTVALGTGSSALGAGDPVVCATAPVNGLDQRGQARGLNACNVGAYDALTAVVNSTGDASDANTFDDICETSAGNGVCTLRAAIEQANASDVVGYIEFDIPGGGVQTIAPASAYPNLTRPVVIDGLTQPGSDCSVWPRTLNVEIDLSSAGSFGLTVNGGSSTVTGLVMNRVGQTGIWLGSAGNTISCNYLGTDPAGTPLSGTTEPISLRVAAADGNTIIGNLLASTGLNNGVFITQDSNVVQGNYIGVTPAGAPLSLGVYGTGVAISGSNNLIGGTGPGEGNLIGQRAGDAVDVFFAGATGNSVRGNSVVRAAGSFPEGLSIDLSSADVFPNLGVTANDIGDADTGSNNLQNYPVLSLATSDVGTTRVVGSLNSTASRTFDIDVYGAAACQASGHGDGETFLGSFQVTTDGAGNVAFDETLPVSVVVGSVISVTATDTVTGDTSEFSGCVPVTVPGPCTTSWTNGSGDDLWTTEANWTAGVPGPTDVVCMDVPGDAPVLINGAGDFKEILRFETAQEPLTINGQLKINESSILDGEVVVAGRFEPVQEVTLSGGGTVGGFLTGPVRVPVGSTLNITDLSGGVVSAVQIESPTVITNEGIIQVTYPTTIDAGVTIDNQDHLVVSASLDVASGASIINDSLLEFFTNAGDIDLTGSGTITNNATLQKTGADRVAVDPTVTVDVSDGGTIAVDAGIVDLSAAGTWTGDGTGISVSVANGARFDWGGNQTLSGTFTGLDQPSTPGEIVMSGTKSIAANATFDVDADVITPTVPGDVNLAWDNLTLVGDPVVLVGAATVLTGFDLRAPLTVSPGSTVLVEENFTNDANGDIVNDGTVIARGQQFGNSVGTFTNNGLFQADRSGSFLSVNSTWISSPSSQIEFLPGTLTDMQSGHTELGVVRVRAGAWAGWSNVPTFADSAELEIEILGPSTDQSNYGFVVFGDGPAVLDAAATLRVVGGYTPVGTDSFRVLRCFGPACAEFTTTDLGLLEQVTIGNDVHLEPSACTTSWTGAVDGDWSVPGNWTNGVPTSTSAVCVDVPGALDNIFIPSGSFDVGSFVVQAEQLFVDGDLTIHEDTVIEPGNVVVRGSLTALGAVEMDGQVNGGTVVGDVTFLLNALLDDATFVGGPITLRINGIIRNDLTLQDGVELNVGSTGALYFDGANAQSVVATGAGTPSINVDNWLRVGGGGDVTIPADVDVNLKPGSRLWVESGSLDVEAGGTWDGNGSPVTVRVDTGQSLRWAGDQFVTGDIVGDFSGGSPGKVRMEGIKTSTTSTTLDFPESPLSPGFANAYMLEWNGVELRGDPWTIDGFVRTWITAPSAGPQATITADTTLVGEIAQQSPQVLINAATFTNSGTYRAIGSASDSIQGTGAWINDGTFRRQPPSGTSTFLINLPTWQTTTNSITEVIGTAGRVTLSISTGYTESGLVSLDAGTALSLNNSVTFDADSTTQITIDGDSSTRDNYGWISFTDVGALDGTLEAVGSYAPTATDSYTIAECLSACPTWSTTITAPLEQSLVGGSVVLALPAPDPVPANKLESDAGLGATGYGTGIDIEGDLAYVSQSDDGGIRASLKLTQRDPLTGIWQTVSNFTPGAQQVEMSATHVATTGADGSGVMVAPVGGFSEFNLTAADPVIDLEGDLLIVGEPDLGQVRIFEWDGETTWTEVFSISGTAGTFGSDVAIDGDLAVVANSSNVAPGEVVVYRRTALAGTWQPAPVATLTSPDTTITDDAWFGSSVDLAGTTLVVGHSLNNFPAEDEGVVWVYDGAPSTYATQTPALLVPSAAGTGDVFGQEVQIDGDFIAVGAPAHNFSGDAFRSGAAFIFSRSGTGWVETDYLVPEDREDGALFGEALSIDDVGSTANVLIGAPLDDNNNGVDAGAVYFYNAVQPDNPTLSFTLDVVDGESPIVGQNAGIPISRLDQAVSLIEENADNATTIGSTALQDTGVSASALAGTPLGATPFGAIAVGNEELANLPILSIGLELEDAAGEEYGWPRILDGTVFDDIPLVNVTVGDVFGSEDPNITSQVDAIPFGAIDVDGTPFGAIPFGAIAMGDVPLTQIPPGPEATTPELIEAGWCDVLAGSSEACVGGELAADATLLSISLSDVPFGAIPFGAIPFGAIPVQDAPFGAIQLQDVRISDTPFGAIPFGAIPFGAIELEDSPFGAIPFGAIPYGAIPFGAIPYGAIPYGAIGNETLADIPFGAIPFGAIDVNGAPFGAIPFGAIALAEVNLGDIPLDPDRTEPAEIEADWCTLMAEFGLDCNNPATAVGTTTVTELGVRGVPFGAIPFGAIPFGAIPFGAIPFGAIPFGAIPFGAINLGAVDVADVDLAGTPFGAIPFGAIDPAGAPFGAISTSVGAIPFGAIDVQGSPFGAIRLDDIAVDDITAESAPFGAIPFGAIPFGAIPFGAIGPEGIPFGAIPFGAIPFGAISASGTVGTIPFGAIDLVDSPFGAIPFGAIPFGAIGTIVDCTAIDCASNATLRDAFLAGAILEGATLADLGDAAADFRLPDLAQHLIGLDAEDLYSAVYAWGADLTLAELTSFANMTLADLPTDNPLFRETVLNDIKAGLFTVTFEDLANALVLPGTADPAAELELVVDEYGDALTLADFATFGDVTFSELLPAFGGSQLGELGAFLAFIHLGDLVDAGVLTESQLDAALSTAGSNGGPWLVIDAVNDPDLNLGDMKIADLIGAAEWGAATVNDLVNALPDDEVAGFTLSDLLLGLLPPGALPWGLAFEKIDAAAIPGVVSPVTLNAEFALTGTRTRSVELAVEIPANAAFVPGSATITPAAEGDLEPVDIDGKLVWTFTGIDPGVDADTQGPTYTVEFDVQPTLSIGSTAVTADSRVIGAAGTASSTTFLQVREAFEPNDVVADVANLQGITQDVIYLLHIADDSDIDLFPVDLFENDALAVDLSGLPADYDVVIYRKESGPVGSSALTRVADAEALVPVLDPDSDGTETIPDQGFPRLDLVDPSLSLIEISNGRGLESETIVTSRLPGGRYYIQVHGHDGANSVEPAVLQINIIEAGEVPVCVARGPLDPATQGVAPLLADLPSDLDTVILVNEMRFEQLYGATGRADVTAALDTMVSELRDDPELALLGLSAAVIPVDGYQSVRDAYQAWDDPATAEAACDPATANNVVSTIVDDVLDPIRDAGHDIENVVLIGNDDMMPFARLQDETEVANEFDYRFDFTGRNSFTSSFWSSTFLSDDPYGETAAQPFGDRYLYVADAALGRLLESPAQIVDQIQQFIDFDGYLAAESGLIAGYDFLVDGSEAIAAELETPAGPIASANLDDELADGFNATGTAWNRDDISNALLLDDTGAPYTDNGFDLVSFNAHFDHYRALPAVGDKVPGFDKNFETSTISGLVADDPRFDGSVIFSMGCHSGLNVPNVFMDGQGVTEDWAEVFGEQLAVYVANTGFGYGDTEVVGYTERLMQLFARYLASPQATDLSDPSTATSIGDALKFAKQQAFAELDSISVYHEKAYQESTFYGLPFFRVGVPPTLPPAAPDNNPEIDPQTNDPAASYFGDPDNTPNLVDRGDGVTETYYSNVNADFDESVITQPGRPIQPSITVDVTDVDPVDSTKLESEARGAIILDMDSSYLQVNPVVAVPVFDQSNPGVEPNIDGIVFPTVPQRITTFETPGGTRQNLVLATGQYRGTEDAGQQRLDSDIDLIVYYADLDDTDRSAPRILTVDPVLDGADLSVTVELDDETGVDRVYVLVTPQPNVATAEWFGLELVNDGNGRWSGGITFASAPEAIELLVQAKDEAGNVGVNTNKAVNHSDEEAVVELPTVSLTSTLTPSGPLVNDIYTGPVTVTADAGGLPVTYRLNNSGAFETLDPAGVVVSGDRAHKVEIVALDGQRITRSFRIDTLPPTATISRPAEDSVFTAGATVTSAFSCADSSLVSCTASVTGPGGTTSELLPGQPLPTAVVGDYVVEVTAVDAVGREFTRPATYSVVATLEVSVTPAQGTAVVGTTYRGPVTVDADAGVVPVSYILNDGDPNALPDGGFVVADDGEYTIEFTSGTQQASTSFTVDATAPVVAINSPGDGVVVGVDAVLGAGFSCEDLVAGVASCVGELTGDGLFEPVVVADTDLLPTGVAGVFTLSVTGTDNVGNTITEAVTFTVDATAPVVSINSPVDGVVVGVDAVLGAGFSCEDLVAGVASCVGELTGDGLSEPVVVADADLLPTDVAGVFTLSVTGTDNVGNTITEAVTFTVSAPPEILSISVPPVPQAISDPVVIEVDFDDPDGDLEDYAVTIDFGDDLDPDGDLYDSTTCEVTTTSPQDGDGSGGPVCTLVSEPDGSSPGRVTAGFAYPRPGVFTVAVTVTDGAGNQVEQVADDYVVVFDPGAGRVSGSGRYWSDASSYLYADEEGEWAHFGYKARYQNNDPTPDGETKLKLKGEFKFTSTGYDYLIINDTMAVAEGVGEIDKVGGYRFRVQGVDIGSTDFFQITIWEDGNPGNIIYNNGVIFEETGVGAGNGDGDEVLFGGIKITS